MAKGGAERKGKAMEYHKLGQKGPDVSRLGFGAIKLPGVSQETADACLNRALDLGVNFVDTSRTYRDSEEKIGHALEARRGEYYLATKTHARDYDGAMRDLETSLRALRTGHIDFWQLHSVSNRETWAEVCAPGGAVKALRRAVEDRVVGHPGITVHRDHAVAAAAIDSGLFETIMLMYNPVDSEGMSGMLARAKRAGLGVIVMKALSGGMIACPPENRRAGFGGPDALVAGALRWVLSNGDVDCVIPGMQSTGEVEENLPLAAPFTPLSDRERRDYVAMLGQFRRGFRYDQRCLRCGYCLPCPQGIDIPRVFQAQQMWAAYPEALKEKGRELYRGLEPNAEACVRCGQCLEKCPAGLEIPDLLAEAARMLA